MRKLAILTLTSLLLLGGCQNNHTALNAFSSIKEKFFKSETEVRMDAALTAIRDGDLDRAELEAAQIAAPFQRCSAFGQIAHFLIVEKNDLISAKKIADRMEENIPDIASKEDKLFAQIQLADLKHFIDRGESEKLLKAIHPDVWSIVNPDERSRLLIRLVALELETLRDVKKAKQTIEETEQTIEFIQSHDRKQRRARELNNLLFVNNHILCQVTQ